ncbi:SDR family oxidoreductase [Pseudonocardia sp. N23]|uniref:SDR family oxidoreductase n=1 Tax=Pseudonocardia sp. N23 TaxID=1987376 RepID=UPI000BFC5928|nr:SDR family oxidoreductase [Pseudonocardia sp. N23]GAY13106.1 oxidoreductase, short chain dehydrogenase/reductase family [Pseudonocardia sp. N23]
MRVAGKVAVVTGGGGGIGAALAAALAGAGARVVVSDIDGAAAERVAAAADAAAGTHVAVGAAADAADPDAIAGLIALAEREFGPVDLYCANAGIGPRGGLDADEAEWDRAIDVNVRAHVRAAKQLVPGWVERGEGYFVSTASAAGLLTQIGSAAYAVTKHAVVGFAEWLAITYGDRGVRVSCLCPMGVDTDMLRAATGSADPMGAAAGRSVVEAGSVLQPAEVAEVVLAAIDDERFLVLPHPEVLEMYRRKGSDYDRWLRGMRRYQASLLGPGT